LPRYIVGTDLKSVSQQGKLRAGAKPIFTLAIQLGVGGLERTNRNKKYNVKDIPRAHSIDNLKTGGNPFLERAL
jgi:hypothetical protein